MSQNIYELLNEVETDFSEYPVTEDLSDLEMARLKKNVFSKTQTKRSYRKLAVAACTILCLSGLALGPFKTQVEAAAKLLTYNIQAAFGINKDLSSYKSILNQSVTSNDITVTLNEVILDRNSIVVSFTEAGTPSNSAMSGDVYVNGQLMESAGSGSRTELDDNTYGSVMEYSLNDNVDTSDTLDIKLHFYPITDDIEGSWEFSFQATGAELNASTTEIPLNAEFTLPNQSKIHLTSMTTNDLGQKIYYDLTGDENNYDLKFEGQDNLGNPIAFYVSRSDETGGYLALDVLSGAFNDQAESLSLTPYAVAFPQENGQMSNDWEEIGDAFEIPLK